MVSVPARRSRVAYATGRGLSQRRACTLMGVGRSALHYRSRKAETDAPVVWRMSELAAQYPRYGYRRIRIFLSRDGHRMSVGRAYRLWRSAGLQVPRRRPRKRVARGQPRPQGFNGKFRDECLSLEWLRSRAEAKVVIEAWRRHYNTVRPHSSLDYLTPEEFLVKYRQTTDDRDPGPQRVGSPELGSSAPRPVAPAFPLAKGAAERVAVSS